MAETPGKWECTVRDGAAFRRPSPYINNLVLAAGVAKTFTCPADCGLIRVSSEERVWHRVNGTAAVPTGDVTDGEGCSPLVDNLKLNPGDTVSIVCATATIVSFDCFVKTYA